MDNESIRFNKNKQEDEDPMLERSMDFLFKRMNAKEAVDFINECLANPEKLEKFQKIAKIRNFVKEIHKKMEEDEVQELLTKNEMGELLNNIYGINLN